MNEIKNPTFIKYRQNLSHPWYVAEMRNPKQLGFVSVPRARVMDFTLRMMPGIFSIRSLNQSTVVSEHSGENVITTSTS